VSRRADGDEWDVPLDGDQRRIVGRHGPGDEHVDRGVADGGGRWSAAWMICRTVGVVGTIGRITHELGGSRIRKDMRYAGGDELGRGHRSSTP
jgi:hypothetical protein